MVIRSLIYDTNWTFRRSCSAEVIHMQDFVPVILQVLVGSKQMIRNHCNRFRVKLFDERIMLKALESSEFLQDG
jgi:hypothetical protein